MLAHLILLTLSSLPALAQEKPIQAGGQMSITYGSPSWNSDSAKIDSAYLVIRDRNSGRLIQINLEETEPDSSKFNGYFSLSDTITPEVYIPPSNIRGEKSLKKLYQLIKDGKIPRKPLIWKKERSWDR